MLEADVEKEKKAARMQNAKSVATILLVDDRPENLFALEKMLCSPELRILKAASGNEALSQVMDSDVSCILLDVQMPEMDGYEVAKLLREDDSTSHIPIIFVTAYSREASDILRGFQCGAVDYLQKPLDETVVKQKVHSFATLNQKKQLAVEEARALEQLNSELKSKTELLQRSNSDLEQFAYVASHDLKEPLRMISNYISIIERDLKDHIHGPTEQHFGFVVDGAKRMYALIEDLLAYSQVGSDETSVQEVSSEELLKTAMTNLKMSIEESGAKIKFTNLPKINVDPIQITQVFQNLLSNAIKFCKDRKPEIEVKAVVNDHSWHFTVSDNGPGINPHYHEKIFGMFQRVHGKEFSGTGIGLAICRRIMHCQGGAMWVQSNDGEGATFHFTIPLKRPTRAAKGN